MAWVSLKIEAQDNTADLISDTLMSQGALSAIIEDANADTLDEQPIFGEPGDPPPGIWQQNLVSALFDEGVDITKVMADLHRQTKLSHLLYHCSYRSALVEKRSSVLYGLRFARILFDT